MTAPPTLFGETSLAELVATREAAAQADASRDADELIRRYSLDVPVLVGAPRILERQLTVPFIDRFDYEIPGGDLLFVAGYPFTGDAALLLVYPAGEKPRSHYASILPDMVVIRHLERSTTIAIEPKDLTEVLERPQPDPVVEDAAAHEQAMNAIAGEMAARISAMLERLRVEAAPANLELAQRIRRMVAGG